MLACGDRAVLSHRSAVVLWGMLPPSSTVHHVTTLSQRRRHRGVTVHRSRSISAADLAAIERIPLTGPARSLLDFADGGDLRELERALNEARALRLLRRRDLAALRARTAGRRGWRALNTLLAAEREPGFSRSEAELRLLRLIRSAGLAEPRRNVPVRGFEVDFLWPEQGLVVEVDGYSYHGDRRAFERDRRKATELQAHGLRLLPFTWLQIAEQPAWVAARIATTLATPHSG